jgi:GT2 family glycosyltransferase
MISAVGIVVPARDEQRLISSCQRDLVVAVRHASPGVDWAVCVVADRCTDDTASAARATFGDHGNTMVLENHRDLTIGEVRDLGMRHVQAMLAGHPAERVWLLSSDADSNAPPDWVTRHLCVADNGADAVAGVVELFGHHALPPLVRARYTTVLAQARRAEGHGNVYAANLGVRASAYRAVGGFGACAVGEDHDLWRRLGQAGYRCCFAEDSVVLTSPRRRGRATGGLADLLHTLHLQAATEETA